jgi:hypothetical protein
VRETPVYVASVGFFCHVRVDRVHDHRAYRLVTLTGFEKRFVDLFGIVVRTGHRPKVTAPGGVRNSLQSTGYASG